MLESRRNRGRRIYVVLLALLTLLAVLAWLFAQPPHAARCPAGLTPLGARCCAEGQHLESGHCRGAAKRCSSAQRLERGRCTVNDARVNIDAAVLQLNVDDWDLGDRTTAPTTTRVDAFAIDRAEVSWAQWRACASDGACKVIDGGSTELPVTGVSPKQAESFCKWRGGTLPTSEQWLLAAAGPEGRRYPWGAFGLVCRRAVFGLQAGPCGEGAIGPEAPGSRPDGATPDGVLDMAGNVAEWTRDSHLRRYIARGGSYRSTLASELKVLGAGSMEQSAPDVGFRCVYPMTPVESGQRE